MQQMHISVKDTQSLKTKPRIQVENNKFSCKNGSCKKDTSDGTQLA